MKEVEKKKNNWPNLFYQFKIFIGLAMNVKDDKK